MHEEIVNNTITQQVFLELFTRFQDLKQMV